MTAVLTVVLALVAALLAPAGQGATAAAASTYSFDVPAGTYLVTVRLGDRRAAAQTGVQVEARRTVLAPVDTAAGQLLTRTLTVTVRTPESMPTSEEGPGTAGLQVRLTGTAPALAGITVRPQPAAPQLFVVSDSTAADWLVGPKRGWAQGLPQLLRPGLGVANYADSGENTVTWLADPKLFATVAPLMRRRDTVLIQLAHNDKTTTEAAYRANLTSLVDGVRARGAQPVLVTPPVRRLFAADGTITATGRVVNSLGVDLPAVIRDLATAQRLPLVDLTARSSELLERLGPAASASLYLTAAHDGVDDNTHFSEHGATVIAGLLAGELRRTGVLTAFLRPVPTSN